MGVIPDLLLGPEKRLVDIKTVCAKKYYRSGLIRGAAGSGEGRRKRKLADSPRQTPLFGGGMLAAVEDDVDGDASRAREAIEKRFAWISRLGPR